MPTPSDWLDAAAEVVGRLTDRWVRAGALAAIVYRSAPRFTTDADILVEWREDLIPALEEAGYVLRVIAMPGDHPHLLQSRGGERGDVDFMIPTEPYLELAIDRGRQRHLLTVEDVIILKLIANRPRDLDDIRSILSVGHDLDLAYMRTWLDYWEIADRWEQFQP